MYSVGTAIKFQVLHKAEENFFFFHLFETEVGLVLSSFVEYLVLYELGKLTTLSYKRTQTSFMLHN